MAVPPITSEELFSTHLGFIEGHLEPAAAECLVEHTSALQHGLPAFVIDNFLRPGTEQALGTLEFDDEGYCRTALDYPIAKGLIDLMSDISRVHVTRHPLLERQWSIKQLVLQTANHKLQTTCMAHHDWKDGNAVLYNRSVQGKQIYHAGDQSIEIANNQLVAIKGDAAYLPSVDAYGTVVHSVGAVPELNMPHAMLMGRERYLAYYDGEPTDVDQLPRDPRAETVASTSSLESA